jgi:hypothetical protein
MKAFRTLIKACRDSNALILNETLAIMNNWKQYFQDLLGGPEMEVSYMNCKMAERVVLDESDALVFTTEITEHSEIECQCCVGLKLELNKIAIELESASKVIEILREELRIADALV